MKQKFILKSVEYGDPLRLSTPGKYSMDTAIELLTELEEDYDCVVDLDNWRCKGEDFIVEKYVPVSYKNIKFKVMCSYEDIFIKRVSGSKPMFYEICGSIIDIGHQSA